MMEVQYKGDRINGDNCVSVEELKVHDGGHDWPGAFGNMDILADEEIWHLCLSII